MTREKAGSKTKSEQYGVIVTTRARRREVEHMMLNSLTGPEIFEKIGERYKIVYGTIKNDMTAVRKIWRESAKDNKTAEKGRERYIATLFEQRRRATPDDQKFTVDGEIDDGEGVKKVTLMDKSRRVSRGSLNFIHLIDKEIAKMSGVELMADTQTVNLSIDAARNYMDTVMRVVFTHVTDPKVQKAITSDLEALDDQGR